MRNLCRLFYACVGESAYRLSWEYRELDGDILRVEAIDQSKDGGVTLRRGAMVNRGPAVHPTHIPTRIRRGGPHRAMPDVDYAWAMPIVTEQFKDIVEKFEPIRHQFFPVDIMWADGALAGRRYFLIVCNRLDSVHRDHTTMRFNNALWEPVPGQSSKIVFDRKRFQGSHMWHDKHLISPPLISNDLANALQDAGIKGLDLRAQDEV